MAFDIGLPQFGHVSAEVEISLPQSGHFTIGIISSFLDRSGYLHKLQVDCFENNNIFRQFTKPINYQVYMILEITRIPLIACFIIFFIQEVTHDPDE
jgi:hypothetical protein